MRRKKVIQTITGLCLLTVLFSIRTAAYFTDREQKENLFSIGYNTTQIVEEFPEITPVPVEDSPTFEKKVWTVSPVYEDKGNVDCYVRLYVSWSNSDIGRAVRLNGIDLTNWAAGEDGYYYYCKKLPQGQATTPLFTSVTIDASRIDKKALKYTKDFRIHIYEESIQAGDFPDYRTAWDHALHADTV